MNENPHSEREKIKINFTSECINEYTKEWQTNEKNMNKENQLVAIYLDRIRNGYEISEEMFLNIETFSKENKMKIIREYNRCMQIYVDVITNI
jgi:hypothetical protein